MPRNGQKDGCLGSEESCRTFIVGCRMVVVHMYDYTVDWYEKQKFKKVSEKLNVMYLDIK